MCLRSLARHGPSHVSFTALIRPAAGAWSPGATWDRAHGAFFWPILVLMVLMAALALAQLLHPRETLLRSLVRAGAHWGSAFMAAILLVRGWNEASAEWRWLSRMPHAGNGAGFPTAVTDVIVYLTVASIAIGASVALAVDVVRMVRARHNPSATPASASPSTEVLCM